ncbi:MAG: hypothetical protein ABF301_07440 [Sulfurovum sp.]|jgi:hypothetical protein|nr:MAG: Uncharacterised protein [Arcobacter lacus]
MENKQSKALDEWELKLEEQLKVLQACQGDKNLSSCNPCDKFFGCELRKKYVKSVYESMSKGSSGGFEF